VIFSAGVPVVVRVENTSTKRQLYLGDMFRA
jgi:hypothetical protein